MTIARHVTGARAGGALLALCLMLFPRCTTEGDPPTGPADPGPPAATLDVEIVVEGAQPDPDGYTIILSIEGEGDRPAQPAGPAGGTIRFPELPPGAHAVRLESLAENCRVTNGSNPRPVTLSAGLTRTLEFTLYCRGPGTLLVRAVTRGRDLDPDGYGLVIEGTSTQEERIGANDTLRIGELELPEGERWTVRLTGIADNCLAVLPNPAQVTPFTRDTPSHLVFSVVCIESGSRIAFHRDGDIFLAPVVGTTVNLTNHPASDSEPSLSPDGRQVLFSSDRDREEGDLYLVDIERGTLTRLTSGPGNHWSSSQAWSPDGSRIVFSSTRDDPNRYHLYVLSLDTSTIVRLTHDPLASDIRAAWSPDGSSIAFCRIREPEDGVFEVTLERMSVDGSGTVRMAEEVCGPIWSPDGSWIAFTTSPADEFVPNEVGVVAAGGGPATILASGWSPAWSPDGGSMAYNTFGGSLVVGTFSGSAVTDILTLFQGFSPSWR
ncbi:MAG TPA: DPP IV N-terminal domain-containing protein [Gemmatimonadota bacterium]|nr:DPP IV N-terminal domain-containing protein [Gemmatimonadota bacterium]